MPLLSSVLQTPSRDYKANAPHWKMPAIAGDGPKLVAAQAEMEAAQNDLETLYARWPGLQ